MRNFRKLLLAGACLAITGSAVAWAQPAQHPPIAGDPIVASEDWVDNPYAPHVTNGATIRLGTVVGFLYGEPLDVYAIGAVTAIGQRFGRFAIEAEFAAMTLRPRGPARVQLGDAERLGVIGRFDVIRIGPRWVGKNSLVALYIEGGAAVAWNHWYEPGYAEAERIVPADSKRVEGQAGFGIALDHRLEQPIDFPHRVGWFLGWRFALAPEDRAPASLCRGAVCRVVPTMPEQRITDRSVLFQSSLEATW